MSKAGIALIITWFVICVAGAFYGGYYYGKNQVATEQSKNQKELQVGEEKESSSVKTTEGQTVKEEGESTSGPTSSPTGTATKKID